METRDKLPDIAASWEKFIATGKMDAKSVRPEIEASWRRCYEARVDPYDGVSHLILDHSEIGMLLRTHKDLIDIARHFMLNLYEFVKSSGFIVLLSDKQGYIMEVMGDYDILDNASQVNLIKGSSWVEKEVGTNGIGTALVLGKPFQVSGREHYCRKLHTWTCSAAPVFDACDRIIGALQMSGPSYAAHLHTLGMVVAAVEAIRDQINVRQRNRELSVLNDSLRNIFQTMSDGAIIVDGNGEIEQINPTAVRMLGDTAVGNPIKNIFGKDSPMDKVLSTGMVCSDIEMMLNTALGKVHSLVTAKPIKNEKGHVTGAAVFFNPINNMKKMVNRFGGAQATFNFKDIIGGHEKLLTAIRTAQKAASSVSNVLIKGESGTGKELFAQAIHNSSPRRRGPFLALNCAALPRDLIASELFGYSQGAFTGANPRGRPGRFEMASGGTLFLDEIGDMPLDQQVSLLRVLQEKKITRLGGNEVIPVDVRIICATNRDLQEAIQKGHFRQDLYYRLDVVLVSVPPLRDRRDDVLILFDYFLKKIGRKLNVDVKFVEPEVRQHLVNYSWPGNVRELENLVEKLINVAEDGRIYTEHLPDELTESYLCNQPELPSQMPPSVKSGKRIKEVLAERERQVILDLLGEYAGNITQVARDLGVSRNTVYRKMQLHGISKEYNFD